jgi:hypothetical protein
VHEKNLSPAPAGHENRHLQSGSHRCESRAADGIAVVASGIDVRTVEHRGARFAPASSRQLPISSFEEWHSVASGVEAVDLDLVAADHQVRVDVGAVDAHAP